MVSVSEMEEPRMARSHNRHGRPSVVDHDHKNEPAHRIGRSSMMHAAVDVGSVFVVWLMASTLVFYSADEDWTLNYAFFFATNVGLGVGYGEYLPTTNLTKYYTSFMCLIGTSLAMGGLVAFFEAITFRTKAASFERSQMRRAGRAARPDESGGGGVRWMFCCLGYGRNHGALVGVRYDDVRFALIGLAYAVMLGVGIVIGCEEHSADAQHAVARVLGRRSVLGRPSRAASAAARRVCCCTTAARGLARARRRASSSSS